MAIKRIATAVLLAFVSIMVLTGITSSSSSRPHRAVAAISDSPTSNYDDFNTALVFVDYIHGVQATEVGEYLRALDMQALVDYIASIQAEEAAQAARVAVAPQPRSNPVVSSSSNPGDFLSCVRNRESGGNYGIYNSGGSGAAGAYQFMPGTWNGIASSSGRGDLVGVDPAQASPADQDAMAQALYAQQGAAPWGGGC